MKIHHPKKTKSTTSKLNRHAVGKQLPEHELERIAEKLLALARSQLPDRVMRGILQGCEDDVRQEAILLALKWYIKHQAKNQDSEFTDWNAAQAICMALKYRKLDMIKKIAKEQQARRLLASMHVDSQAAHWPAEKWSPAEIRQILEESIQQALKSGLISHANASIAILVYVEGVSVKDLATNLNRTKGAIHQQLNRVRKAIPGIIQSMRAS